MPSGGATRGLTDDIGMSYIFIDQIRSIQALSVSWETAVRGGKGDDQGGTIWSPPGGPRVVRTSSRWWRRPAAGMQPALTSGTNSMQSMGKNGSYILKLPDRYDKNRPCRLSVVSTDRAVRPATSPGERAPGLCRNDAGQAPVAGTAGRSRHCGRPGWSTQ